MKAGEWVVVQGKAYRIARLTPTRIYTGIGKLDYISTRYSAPKYVGTEERARVLVERLQAAQLAYQAAKNALEAERRAAYEAAYAEANRP